MDLTALIATGISTGIISIPLAAYLGKIWIEHQLEKGQSVWEAKIRREIESFLADQAAQRQYDWDARKRLYEAIGPLRFQLLLACRDLSGRIEAHGTREHYRTSVRGYYGQSTLHRIVRPITIGLLIERQMAYADFAVDPGALTLMRFSYLARQCLSGDLLVNGHSHVDWDTQKQHVFSEVLTTAGVALVIEKDDQPPRVMRFDEMETVAGDEAFLEKLDPFPSLLERFSPTAKPLLWLRLVAYANLCRHFVADNGKALNLEVKPLDIRGLLEATKDAEILKDIDLYAGRCQKILELRY